ncbi:MAG: AAA-like domain-containing protein, partial [Cyanobacteria bacterium J06600_6]
MSEYQVGGSLNINASTYVVRQADRNLFEALSRGEFCYVFNCRQMGKSSLRVQVKNRLEQQKFACVSIDMTNIGSQSIEPLQWYKSIASEIWRGLNLIDKVSLKQWWQEHAELTPIQHLNLFISDVVLHVIKADKIVIFIDEIDSVLSLNFNTDDFFALIRYFYNARAENPDFKRLSFALFGVATPNELIGDSSRTPFNIGTAIALSGFTSAEAKPLAQGLQECFADADLVLEEIINWTGGQPFLTQKICKLAIDESHLNQSCLVPKAEVQWVGNLIQTKIIQSWETQDEPEHLKTIRDRLLRNETRASRLIGLSIQIQQLGFIQTDESPEQRDLLLSNLVIRQQDRLVFRNRIYQQIFNLHWLRRQQIKLNPFDKQAGLWLESGGKDKSRLLRGKTLQEAQAWAKTNSISQSEYQFLTASQEQEQLALRQRLELDRLQAIEVRLHQEQKLARTQRFLLSTIGAALAITTILGVIAWEKFGQARINEVKALSSFSQSLFVADHRFEALLKAIEATQKNRQTLNSLSVKEPAMRAESALRQAVYGVLEYNRLEENLGTVFSVDISPDGSKIATAGEDKILRLWQSDGVLLRSIQGHQARIWDVEFSPDGTIIATASRDRTIKLWSQSGQEITTLRGHQDAVLGVEFSPDSQMIASVSRDRTVKLWSRDGKLLSSVEAHNQEIHDLAFSPIRETDRTQLLVTAGNDRTVKLWKIKDQKILPQPLLIIDDFQDDIRTVAFSPQPERTIAVGGHDGRIKLFNLNGKLKHVLPGHQNTVSSLQFSADGQHITSVSWDETIKIWRSDGSLVKTIKDDSERIWGLALSDNGKTIATAGERHGVKLWRASNPLSTRFNGHQAAVIDVAYHPTQDIIASASDDRTIKLTTPQGELLATWSGEQTGVLAVSYHPDGSSLVSGHNDGSVRLWEIDPIEPTKVTQVTTLANYQALVWRIAHSPDGSLFVTAGEDNTVKLWDSQGKVLKTFTGHEDAVRSVAFSPDGKLIASGSLDNTVKIWNLQGEVLHTLAQHQGGVIAVDFSPVMNAQTYWLVSGSRDTSAKIWRIEKESAAEKLKENLIRSKMEIELQGHEEGLRGVRFSPDGKTVATAGRDRSIKLWQRDGTLLKTLFGHDGAVWQVRFDPEQQTIISGGEDQTVMVWDLERISNLDLLGYGCNWIKDYLT